jgi:hypothetical protein
MVHMMKQTGYNVAAWRLLIILILLHCQPVHHVHDSGVEARSLSSPCSHCHGLNLFSGLDRLGCPFSFPKPKQLREGVGQCEGALWIISCVLTVLTVHICIYWLCTFLQREQVWKLYIGRSSLDAAYFFGMDIRIKSRNVIHPACHLIWACPILWRSFLPWFLEPFMACTKILIETAHCFSVLS